MPRLSGTLRPTSLYHAESFANFEGILGFSVQSFILLDLLGNTRSIEQAKTVMLFSFIVGKFQSVFFVSVFQDSLLVLFVIVLFRAMSTSFLRRLF